MTINPKMMTAVNAYNDAASKVREASRSLDARSISPAETHPAQEFSEVLRSSVQDAISLQHKSEKMSMKAVANEADLAEVVTAVADAELTLQTVVTIRDKVVQAYQDIIRMPI